MGPADTWKRMGDWLSGLAHTLAEPPRAVLVISAHWEAPAVSITGAAKPELIYDYYGFPEHTYAIEYAAPGAPALASEIVELLVASGIEATTDPSRGFDHGVFIPLKLIFPEADVPVIQMSLHASLDPSTHIEIGRAIAPLRKRGVLILGSGMSYHNLPLLMRGAQILEDSDRFDTWLKNTCAMDCASRALRLAHWQDAPAARSAHPREEHLIPLMVAAGAGEFDRAECVFSDRVMGSTVSAFQFD